MKIECETVQEIFLSNSLSSFFISDKIDQDLIDPEHEFQVRGTNTLKIGGYT